MGINWRDVAGAAAGAARGYEGAKGRALPAPNPDGRFGMNYQRRRPPFAPPGPASPSAPPDVSGIPMPQTGMAPSVAAPPLPSLAQGGVAPSPAAVPYPYMNQGRDDGQRQMMADGEVVTKPTTAVLGEDGPEMVVPLSGRPGARVSPANLPGLASYSDAGQYGDMHSVSKRSMLGAPSGVPTLGGRGAAPNPLAQTPGPGRGHAPVSAEPRMNYRSRPRLGN